MSSIRATNEYAPPTNDADEPHEVDTDPVFRRCQATLAYAREREYVGWDYADGLSSAYIKRLPFESKLLNLVVQESIKRAPINLRPYFRVETKRNYKGAALFAMANLDVYALSGEQRYAREARELVEWLREADNDWCDGFCGGGHRHPLQDLSSDGASTPGEVSGIVSTSYAVQALLQAADVLEAPEYADLARTATEFVFEELAYTDRETGACIAYTAANGSSNDGSPPYTLNANALGARLLLELAAYFDEPQWREAGEKILDYVAAKQTATGGWMYTDPPTASHLSMDNFHNGFIVESLLRHRELTDSKRYETTLERALSFYRSELFEEDGAPNWDESSAYPRDVHAAAQGIITFTEAGDLEFARRIVEWTTDALYAGDGQFYYQQRRFYTKRFTLMRWCQAWMAYALSTYMRARYGPL
ncbi:antibiotic ABC transporter permease [Natrialbaceae archaeon AArc-T1-2]|uniref:antibiotic ABC transporter permease n=1 Tax=Natrialbaceae archaeon AArc-T1-2 TaxID=3053904 RepID=UPI00255AD5C5|nr:antibiotic ABC transporter permease [Natrialbaceae archaeon AArc-T1-2]WIV68613.1 antibiotic ABC transporter permease [Natrialbaceae archaeon AArc-T1-2]